MKVFGHARGKAIRALYAERCSIEELATFFGLRRQEILRRLRFKR